MYDVSIIVPVFNTEEYISRCIESILKEKSIRLQLIIIDDGSTDTSPQIARRAEIADQRVLLIRKKNEGQGIARNVGLSFASSKYVYFVDSDDYLDPGVIEKLFRSSEKFDLDLCSPRLSPSYISKPLEYISTLPSSSQFFKSTLVSKFQLKQPNISSGQDGVFAHLLLTRCKRIGMVRDAVYHYTKDRPGSTFLRHKTQHHLAFDLVRQHLNYISKYYTSHDLWRSNTIRLANFLMDETIPNRIRPHLSHLTAYDKRQLFQFISKICKKIVSSNYKQAAQMPEFVWVMAQDYAKIDLLNAEQLILEARPRISFQLSRTFQVEKTIICEPITSY